MTRLVNTGEGPLEVPGFGSIPLDYQLPPEARFAHGLVDYRHSPRLTRREMAMLRLMQRITEQPEWDRAILDSDQALLTHWHREATEGPEGFLISAAAWDWCLAELRDKAREWRKTGRLLIFDSSSVVCQSDVSVPGSNRPSQEKELKEGFQAEVARLRSSPLVLPDCPLVDPCLYPLVYGHSRVLVHGGHVALSDLWSSVGNSVGDMPAPPPPPHPLDGLQHPITPFTVLHRKPGLGGQESCWSNRFQWLPCEVQFKDTATAHTDTDPMDIRITSYVNNLHPVEHRQLYGHLEHLIARSIPSWNEVLFYGNTRGRHPPRILTYGCRIHKPREEHPLFDRMESYPRWQMQCKMYEEWQELCSAVREYVQGPEPPKWKQADPLPDAPDNLLDLLTPGQWDIPKQVRILARLKRTRQAWFDHPEPGHSFSYEQWKRGRFTGRAIHSQRISRFPDPLHHDYTPVKLEKQFRVEGLQVVVEIARIDLTPENPTYSGESHFHTEGLRNERIVATSVYAVEAKNVTQARVAFQHEDKVHASELQCEVPQALATVLDVDYWKPYTERRPPRALHTFGTTPLREGQLLTWPNTYRTKQEPFRLVDPSQPGNLTLVKLRLVDPHYRICSTRNVPPQQHDWWATAARQAANLDKRLPPELVCSVMEHIEHWPISAAEAEIWRGEFLGDHKRAQKAIDACVGHHIITLLPYDEKTARRARDGTAGAGYESP
ncbi:hypothetical protein ASPACDRAFT_1884306 [Aspergillus aculeatus ATCC 16872]|uniref:Uncharacterized protein n=1 Tax=Aspergillus aculeatus (strain ATCC 16872 / CBS 172.66 / WB 5094) TaxID=690307 RepID=A0A1L9X865_ASPA1|nr:uncharacterized protein ASPACDRAFT_1884306 [Aspergillus aculeatus ATCC 16872]OJK04635.1 hypothetical protein ASPACDRAFT_1884306 [Aspergillus aculeatus ATCC 16872]